MFAITQLSQQVLDDLSVAAVARAGFLLLVVWWAWIYTTWMANWFEPASPAVLAAVMLGSLIIAAALPEAFGDHGMIFPASHVALQVGRNAAAAWLTRGHRLRGVFERVGRLERRVRRAMARRRDDRRRRAPRAVDTGAHARTGRTGGGLLAAGSWPVRHDGYDIEGSNFAERCQVFIIIALGESIIVTDATASKAGLTATVVLCLIVAFAEIAALWSSATAACSSAWASGRDGPPSSVWLSASSM